MRTRDGGRCRYPRDGAAPIVRDVTYPLALLQALLSGVVLYAVTATGPYGSEASVLRSGVGAAVVALFLCGFVAYRNGRTNKR